MLTREGVNDKFVDDKGIDGNNMRENLYGHKRNVNQKFDNSRTKVFWLIERERSAPR